MRWCDCVCSTIGGQLSVTCSLDMKGLQQGAPDSCKQETAASSAFARERSALFGLFSLPSSPGAFEHLMLSCKTLGPHTVKSGVSDRTQSKNSQSLSFEEPSLWSEKIQRTKLKNKILFDYKDSQVDA